MSKNYSNPALPESAMRRSLHALTDELRRLKMSGVKTITISDESLAALRKAIAARTETGRRERETAVIPAGQVATEERKDPAPPEGSRPPGSNAAAFPPRPAFPPPPTVELPEGDKAMRWAALREIVQNDVTCCANVRTGKKIVLGVGSLDAKIMFVGEAPGAEEELQGEPFVGPAGQLLTRMIQGMGLRREDVYIGNIMNWRPQMPTVDGREQVGNRPPNLDEMCYCMPYLRAQIEIVDPALLVALGTTAAQGLLGPGSFKALGDIRGAWREFAGRPLMVTYHPSYILRNQSNRSKRMIWEDLLMVMERAELPISDKQRRFFLG
jgi:uracil-DNA glycosylase